MLPESTRTKYIRNVNTRLLIGRGHTSSSWQTNVASGSVGLRGNSAECRRDVTEAS